MALLDDVKSYLHVSWEEDDDLIRGYIRRGQSRLNNIAGYELDYQAEGLPRALLLDYCRYANAQALEVFEQNFASELLTLHMDTQVNAALQEMLYEDQSTD